MRQHSEHRGAKARQALELAEFRAALIAGGFDTINKQASALGLGRSTTWALLNRDKRAGPSASVIKGILSSPSLPPVARRKIEEYVREKVAAYTDTVGGEPRRFANDFVMWLNAMRPARPRWGLLGDCRLTGMDKDSRRIYWPATGTTPNHARDIGDVSRKGHPGVEEFGWALLPGDRRSQVLGLQPLPGFNHREEI